MSATSTTAARIVPSDNARPARRRHLCLVGALDVKRSSQSLWSDAFITFISKPHNNVLDLFLRPTGFVPVSYLIAPFVSVVRCTSFLLPACRRRLGAIKSTSKPRVRSQIFALYRSAALLNYTPGGDR